MELQLNFTRIFFNIVGQCMFNSFVYTFDKGELSQSQCCGVIKLIPKKDNYDFVWDDNCHCLSKQVMQQPLSQTGLNMLNVKFQSCSLQRKWFLKLLNPPNPAPFWTMYVKKLLIIDVHDFLQCNITYQSMHRLFTNYEALPLFSKRLFQEWFKNGYVNSWDFLQESQQDRGFLFNSAYHFHWEFDLEKYLWLKDGEFFIWSEVQVIWKFLSKEDRCFLLDYFLYGSRGWIQNKLGSDLDNLLDGQYLLVSKEGTTA